MTTTLHFARVDGQTRPFRLVRSYTSRGYAYDWVAFEGSTIVKAYSQAEWSRLLSTGGAWTEVYEPVAA